MEVPGVLERRCRSLLPVCGDALLTLPLAGTCNSTSESFTTSCTDTPTSWMVNNGKSCSEDVNYSNKCKNTASWVTNKFCQQSCYDNGAGYDGDDCSSGMRPTALSHRLICRFSMT